MGPGSTQRLGLPPDDWVPKLGPSTPSWISGGGRKWRFSGKKEGPREKMLPLVPLVFDSSLNNLECRETRFGNPGHGEPS